MTDFREELETQIAFESEKDLTGEWTEEYREGYVDGLKQALAVVIEPGDTELLEAAGVPEGEGA
jgi:hypothetical protein